MTHSVRVDIGGRTLSIETGAVARQADGAAWVRYGDTVVLVAAVASKETSTKDFFPLMMDYREKSYAAGKIPGGFFKREGRPTEKEIISSRMMDRPIRPLFPKGYKNEVQVAAIVLSSDQENDSDLLAMIGASAALNISSIPFSEPVAAVRVGRINGELKINPTFPELDDSDMDIVVVGTSENIVMVEGSAKEVLEKDLLEAMKFAHEHVVMINKIQKELIDLAGKPKREWIAPPDITEIKNDVAEKFLNNIREAYAIADKEQRGEAMAGIQTTAIEQLSEKYPESEELIKDAVGAVEKGELRRMILEEGKRSDGRGVEDIREITCKVGVLPRTHGSALFTRGQTQSIVVTTMGTSRDEQRVEELEGESWKSYMLHYNFPPFSVGEVRPIRGPGRREIGHGVLAERAIAPVIPSDEVFPYTLRIVSEILESNGSSSMATVCGGILSLMDAGVPIKAPVAGIAMGLIKEGDKVAILTDILGIEDHLGDMDFKVTGTRAGITAWQMDVKIGGIGIDLMEECLERARKGRLFVLDAMEATINKPRSEISQYAPRVLVLQINPDKIRDVIGPGGRVIKKITEETGAQIDIEDTGVVKISSVDAVGGERAAQIVRDITEDPEIGKLYHGKVKKVVNFGAFVEILPNKDGLLHISEIDNKRVARVEDVLNEGDQVDVKVIGIDREGKIKLSRKAVLNDAPEKASTEA
jgi:polyribonucleotide nucleotidyltransferase